MRVRDQNKANMDQRTSFGGINNGIIAAWTSCSNVRVCYGWVTPIGGQLTKGTEPILMEGIVIGMAVIIRRKEKRRYDLHQQQSTDQKPCFSLRSSPAFPPLPPAIPMPCCPTACAFPIPLIPVVGPRPMFPGPYLPVTLVLPKALPVPLQ